MVIEPYAPKEYGKPPRLDSLTIAGEEIAINLKPTPAGTLKLSVIVCATVAPAAVTGTVTDCNIVPELF